MIPTISKRDVLAALRHIDREAIPSSRTATKFALLHEGRSYPPKYVVSLAVEVATGKPLSPQSFSGGAETNTLLRALGFEIIGPKAKQLPRTPKPSAASERRPKAEGTRSPPQVTVPRAASSTPTRGSAALHTVGRLIVDGPPPGTPQRAEKALYDALRTWPTEDRVKFLITPGGFASAPMPTTYSGGVAWTSRDRDLEALLKVAEPALARVLSDRVLKAAKNACNYLTVGLDLQRARKGSPRAELVAVVETSNGKVRWTGKSYPTSSEENELVQVTDLRSHLLELDGERVLVLGCHDLNMWSPRGRANRSEGSVRNKRCTEMQKLAATFKPTVALQHPHTTDSARIWSVAWSGVRTELPSVRAYGSGIAYHNWDGRRRGTRDSVQASTRLGSVIDRVLKT